MVETFPKKTLIRFQKNAILPTDKQNQPLIRSSHIIQATLKKFPFTEEEPARRHEQGGSPVPARRVDPALVYLKQAGLVISPARAQFCITDKGKQALSSGEEINRAYLNKICTFCHFLLRIRGWEALSYVEEINVYVNRTDSQC